MSTPTGILLLAFFGSASAHIIECNDTNPCRWSDITCNPNEDCFLLCNGAQSCIESTITCPSTGDCNIQCQGGQSCRNAVINATYSSGNFDLQCLDSTDHCRNMKIYGSILETNTGTEFNVLCNGKLRSCINSEIHCPLNGDCAVECSSDSSCRWAHITGPTNGELSIECLGIKSCFDGVFDASNSWGLEVAGCLQDESCLDLTLYCPPHSNGSANCHIQGNDNLGKDNAGGTTIYAVNGWKDVVVDYSGMFLESRHKGTMFCGERYNHSCSIAADQWLCAEPDHYCNNVDATLDPTAQPTVQPTANPIFVLTVPMKHSTTTSTTETVDQRDIVSNANSANPPQSFIESVFTDKSQLLVFFAVITGIMALCISCVACNKCKNYIEYKSAMPDKQTSADSISSTQQKEFDMAITTMININDSSHCKYPMDKNEPGSPRYVDNESSLNSAEIQTEGKSLITTNHIAGNITRDESADNTLFSQHGYGGPFFYQDRHSLFEPSNTADQQLKQNKDRRSADLASVATSLVENGWPITSGSIHEIYITPQPPHRELVKKASIADKLQVGLSPLQSRQHSQQTDSDHDVVQMVNELQTSDSVQAADSVQPPVSEKSDSVEQNVDEQNGGSDSELYLQGPKESITQTSTDGSVP